MKLCSWSLKNVLSTLRTQLQLRAGTRPTGAHFKVGDPGRKDDCQGQVREDYRYEECWTFWRGWLQPGVLRLKRDGNDTNGKEKVPFWRGTDFRADVLAFGVKNQGVDCPSDPVRHI